jgi:hypothetical protein
MPAKFVLVLIYDTSSALWSAWEGSYTGANQTLLFNNINAMSRSNPHSSYVAIIQSSGTHRELVHEQAKLVFTIPFNICDPAGGQGECHQSSIYDL